MDEKPQEMSTPSVSYEDRDDCIIVRRAIQSEDNSEKFCGVPPIVIKPTCPELMRKAVKENCECSRNCFVDFWIKIFPIITWLRNYQKSFIVGDIISGITVGIIHVPQSLAFSLLAGLPAVFGLYTTFYPVLIYTLMGTSQHIAVGTFAITSILTLGVVDRLVPDLEPPPILNDSLSTTMGTFTAEMSTELFETTPRMSSIGVRGISEHDVERAQVASALMFLAGLFQIIFGICRLGLISDYMSGTLLQAYATGAAFHVVTSQLPAALGVKVKAFPGVIGMIKTWIEICKALPTCNTPTLVVTAISMVILIAGREVNMRYKEKLKMPIPVVIMLVIVAIIISYFAELDERFGIDTVKYIPIGFPPPALPKFSVMGQIIGDGIATAIVAFAINLSVAKLFALQKGYEIDPNQELLAYGFTNLIPSFFLCFPNAAALARCAIQVNTGGNTQIVGVITCVIVMIVLVVLGPVFEPLPRSVLGCIIIVGLFTILGKFSELPALYRKSKFEFLIWCVTCLGVIVLGVDFGLFLGIGVAILTVIIRTQRPNCEVLVNVKGSEIYRNKKTCTNFTETPGVVIFKFYSCLYYANKDFFKGKVERKILSQIETEEGGDEYKKIPAVNAVVFDMGAVAFTDIAGVGLLLQLFNKFKKNGIDLYLADCNHDVLGTLNRLQYFNTATKSSVFVSVHDAVTYSQMAKPNNRVEENGQTEV